MRDKAEVALPIWLRLQAGLAAYSDTTGAARMQPRHWNTVLSVRTNVLCRLKWRGLEKLKNWAMAARSCVMSSMVVWKLNMSASGVSVPLKLRQAVGSGRS